MDALFSFLSQLQAWHWFAFALFLLIVEIATGTTYVLWPAAAAAITGLILLFAPIDWPLQLGLFAVLAIGLTVTGHKYVRGRWLTRGGSEQLNDRGAQMIGQRALAAGAFVAGVGNVKVGDSMWRAASDEEIGAGDALDIIGVEGVTLKVKKPASAATSLPL